MLGPETIRNISDVAAYRAAEEGRYPLSVWGPLAQAIEDVRNIPFLGSYCPAGYRPATFADLAGTGSPILARYGYRSAGDIVDLLVDSSGWGNETEPALTLERFAEYAIDGYWAIVEAGQFQIVARLYVQDNDAPGEPGPDEADVTCNFCNNIHNDLEECDGPWCLYCGMEPVDEVGDMCDNCADEEPFNDF